MYTYKFQITSVYDGDTVTGIVDLGFNISKKIKVRLAKINTPEIRTRDLEEKAAGYEARDFLRELVAKQEGDLTIKTTKKGKYGRWIGLIYYGEDNEQICINDELVSTGHAVYKEY